MRRLNDGAMAVGWRSLRAADLRLAHWLCGHLYRLAETRDTAKHRDRRGGGRRAPCAGLGGCDSLHRWAGIGVVHDYIHVDTTAFLVPRDRSARGVRQGGDTHAASDPWNSVYAASNCALYDLAHSMYADAGTHWH